MNGFNLDKMSNERKIEQKKNAVKKLWCIIKFRQRGEYEKNEKKWAKWNSTFHIDLSLLFLCNENPNRYRAHTHTPISDDRIG